MKLVVAGFGQCGGRIADEFARLNGRARVLRGIDIIVGTFAANTDVADLNGLTRIRPDRQHRILLGNRRTGGHGVGKINELGAQVAREDADKVLEALRNTPRFAEADAFLLIASASGGTGSGSIAVMTQQIKERYIDKPVYNLIVLPFEHEQETEQRAIYNTATCLKSSYLVADAVLLVDNQRYVRKDEAISTNFAKINAEIVEPFFNILCAGEEEKPKYIAAKMLDAGDIIQTISGWTTIGYGKSRIPSTPLFFRKNDHFRDKLTETQRGTQAIDKAVSRLSLQCNPKNAGRALYLVSGPPKEINVDVITQLGNHLKRLAPEAIIRSGDYPRGKGSLDVTIILSELSDVGKVTSCFAKAIDLITAFKKRQEGMATKQQQTDITIKDIPLLI